jgi:hypothetical protein
MATTGAAGSAGSDGTYDPRYDPAFQRGFDSGDRAAGGVSARPPGRPVADPSGPRPDPDGAAEGTRPAPEESSWFTGTASAGAEITPASPESGERPTDASALERAAVLRARAHRIWTAYTVGLSAISAACMAFGVVLVTRAYGVFNSTTVDSRDDIYWAQLGGQFGPWVFVVGLATGIGVIFLHAARWRPPPD